MRKSPLLPTGLLPALAMAASGCAHQPPPSVAGQLNVMQMASDMGYNQPRVINGETLFCQSEQLTGSLVPKVACINGNEVIAKTRAQGDLLRYMESPTDDYPKPIKP